MAAFFMGNPSGTLSVYDGGGGNGSILGWRERGCGFRRVVGGASVAAKRLWVVNPEPFCNFLATPVDTGRRLIRQPYPLDKHLSRGKCGGAPGSGEYKRACGRPSLAKFGILGTAEPNNKNRGRIKPVAGERRAGELNSQG